MTKPENDTLIQPDAAELIQCPDARYVCETYIFEPTAEEEDFGFLFVAGETEDNQGIGSELIDTVVTAIQKEYYRDPSRTPANSFELALHQANLILHDTAAQGVRDWMGYFHMAVGILVNNSLHISVAGGGRIFLARKSILTEVSAGLAHFPITNALQTFSQVASGEVKPRDTIFFASSGFGTLFNLNAVGRLTLEPAAADISARLEHLYKDQGSRSPLAAVTVSLLPGYVGFRKHAAASSPLMADNIMKRNTSGLVQSNIRPRQPLIIHRSLPQRTLLMFVRTMKSVWQLVLRYLWPAIKQGSRHSGLAIIKAGKMTSRNLQTLTQKRNSADSADLAVNKTKFSPAALTQTVPAVMGGIKSLPTKALSGARQLPRTSKIFAVVALLLLVALAVSLILLQRKRTADQFIEQASETLYEARTKVEAAETSLIYDNREQARGLLDDASRLVSNLAATNLYQQETQELQQQITRQTDRLQRITRITPADIRVVADTGSLITGQAPKNLFQVGGNLYTVNPDNNSLVKITPEGQAGIVHQTTQGIGFIIDGSPHQPDKTITLGTSPAGIALFDTTNDTLLTQDIQFSSSDPNIVDMAVFGNRLYLYDSAAQNILSFNKTLRGYSSGTPWITAGDFPKSDIKGFGVDGNIFTLHKDGSIKRLFKGEPADFVQESVQPALTGATKLITSDELQYIYILDPGSKRLVIYTKTGALVGQIFVETQNPLQDLAVDPDEKKAFGLDGTRVIEISLASETAAASD